MATKLIKISRDAQADYAGEFARFERESGLKLFTSRMSHPARTVLALMLERLFKVTTIQDKSALIQFAKSYSAVAYDDAVLCWNYAELIDTIKRATTWQGKKREDIICMALLGPLYSHDMKIDESANKQFRIGNDASRNNVYEYITQEYLVNDFGYNDLILLGQIAKDYSVIRIREKCGTITSPDKHTIPYLWAILQSDKQKDAAVKQNRDKSIDRSSTMIRTYMEEVNAPSIPFTYDPNWADDLKIEREMLELKADQGDNHEWQAGLDGSIPES
jgi:hypothetical protein